MPSKPENETIEQNQPGISFDVGERLRAANGRAIVIHPHMPGRGGMAPRSAESRLEEAISLTAAIELEIVAAVIVNLVKPKPGTLLGPGKLEEFAALIEAEEVDVVVIDGTLTPVQQRNLERALGAKVIDRTGLILEIFGERAETKEGRLQVDLAHLTYQKSRLVRSWTHLERQRGGGGFMGGPGETQREADRRTLTERIGGLERQLAKVAQTRELHRKGRRKVPYPIISLVGYTNAGKSTLFNQITSSSVFAKDLLFATLDPTLRGIALKTGKKAILSDTVGFISDLPHELVAAFRATLEEVKEADIILHVRDISHEDTDAQRDDVLTVLEELGIAVSGDTNILEIWNKADQLSAEDFEVLTAQAARRDDVVMTSALKGGGIDDMFDLVDQRLGAARKTVDLAVPPSEGALLAWLHAHGEVVSQTTDDDGTCRITVDLEPADFGRLTKDHPDMIRGDIS